MLVCLKLQEKSFQKHHTCCYLLYIKTHLRVSWKLSTQKFLYNLCIFFFDGPLKLRDVIMVDMRAWKSDSLKGLFED